MPILQKITPFLWFNTEAEEAAKFYTSIFRNSKITGVSHYPPNAHRPQGTVMTVAFELEGLTFTAINGGPQFPFTEAISLVIACKDQAEIDYFWEKLVEGGGKHVECGWLKDKFGLVWQVCPDILPEMLRPGVSDKVMAEVMTMKKLDYARLKKAAGM